MFKDIQFLSFLVPIFCRSLLIRVHIQKHLTCEYLSIWSTYIISQWCRNNIHFRRKTWGVMKRERCPVPLSIKKTSSVTFFGVLVHKADFHPQDGSKLNFQKQFNHHRGRIYFLTFKPFLWFSVVSVRQPVVILWMQDLDLVFFSVGTFGSSCTGVLNL